MRSALQLLCLCSLAACSAHERADTPGATRADAGTVRHETGGATPGASGGMIASSAGGSGGSKPMASGGTPSSGAGGSAGSKPNSTGGVGASGSGAGALGGAAGTAPPSAFRCPSGPFPAPVPSGASVSRIDGVPPLDAFNANGTTRTNIEGAVWIEDTLYVSEFPFTPAPTSRVIAVKPGSGSADVHIAIASCGCNGLAVDAQGDLIATDHKLGAVERFTFPLATPATIVASYDGKRFDSPNDLAVRSDGTLYFSDPDYQAPSMKPQPQTRLYRVAPGASEATVIDAARSEPNGVTLSPDEHTLYVSGSDGIEAYPVMADGSVGAGVRVMGFSGGADGLAVDCAGNLYATSSQRVAVLSPAGAEIASIPVPDAESVTNLAFGGPERKTLFITSMGTGNHRGVFRIDLAVPGLPY